ncbi:MAG: putative baseplate assembly protein, partial [Chloroflexi bacterium]|nr:putative baseplate assembly protein [Chloroflexota bacterium]
MALPAPNLDDRKFQDIVTEARGLIPRYCPEWTDHNLSDPGITFIELFAWMTDMMLYRLNQVPERNYIKFLDLMGVKLKPPRPARADITFRLSAPQPKSISIPRGVEVATVRTETEEAITFTTEREFTISVPHLSYCLVSREDKVFHDYMPVIKSRDTMDIFQKVPLENDALYLGFAENMAGNTLRVNFEASIEGIGVDPRNPPLAWEYWDGEDLKWGSMRLESDTTGGLNRDGEVVVHVPYASYSRELDGKTACWIRARVIKPRPRQPGYSASPRVRSVSVSSIGGSVPASHAYRCSLEVIGRSNGQPGQIFHLHNKPVLPRNDDETVEVEGAAGAWERWHEVTSFASSKGDDLHFSCDSYNGEIQFGPRLRQPDGGEHQFGAVPPKGKQLRFSSYRCGGGTQGNVGEKTLTVLKTSIPYIAWVTNFDAARGGLDAESIDNAKLRAPEVLKARIRAVTADDFEYLAKEASQEVQRARCLAPKVGEAGEGVPAGGVKILIIPVVAEHEGQIPVQQLMPSDKLIRKVTDYLDQRRMLTVQMMV